MLRRIVMTTLVLSILSIGVVACNPAPSCGDDHRGWVLATVLSGPNQGAQVSIYMEWTTMGNKPGCTGAWTGNAHAYNNYPYTGCFKKPAMAGSEFKNLPNGEGVEGKTRCHFSGLTVEVFVGSYVMSGTMWSDCYVVSGSASLRCEHQHVT